MPSLTPIGDLNRNCFEEKGSQVFRKIIDPRYNSVGAVRTLITTTATLIDLPDDAESVSIKHLDTGGIIWIGEDNTITAGGSNAYPLSPGDPFLLRVKRGNSNNLWAIVSSETAYIYALGAFDS